METAMASSDQKRALSLGGAGRRREFISTYEAFLPSVFDLPGYPPLDSVDVPSVLSAGGCRAGGHQGEGRRRKASQWTELHSLAECAGPLVTEN